MPKLDFMIPAQFVRHLGGMLDILGAGIDTIHTAVLPTSHSLGLAVRITFDSTDKPGEQHELKFVFNGDDEDLLTVHATLTAPPKLDHVPMHWKTGVGLALSLTVPIPRYGDYSLVLLIDGQEAGDLDFRAIPLEKGGAGAA